MSSFSFSFETPNLKFQLQQEEIFFLLKHENFASHTISSCQLAIKLSRRVTCLKFWDLLETERQGEGGREERIREMRTGELPFSSCNTCWKVNTAPSYVPAISFNRIRVSYRRKSFYTAAHFPAVELGALLKLRKADVKIVITLKHLCLPELTKASQVIKEEQFLFRVGCTSSAFSFN